MLAILIHFLLKVKNHFHPLSHCTLSIGITHYTLYITLTHLHISTMSWSEGREKREKMSFEKKQELIRNINAVLKKFTSDSDLQDDLKDPTVKIAIKHWTGVDRLPIEKAKKFENSYKVLSVMSKFKILHNVCNELCIPVPLDHLLNQKSELCEELVLQYVGQSVSNNNDNTTTTTNQALHIQKSDPKLAPDEYQDNSKSSTISNVNSCKMSVTSPPQEETTLEREKYDSNNYSIFKSITIVRSVVECVIAGLFAYIVILWMEKRHIS